MKITRYERHFRQRQFKVRLWAAFVIVLAALAAWMVYAFMLAPYVK